MIKISIVLPVYNVESFLERSIESILDQSFNDFELIIINDGSTDKSGSICEKYAKIDGRIKLFHQKNMGLSMARNRGINISNGNYITFVDSDDYIHRDMLKILYDKLVKNQADISLCDYRPVYENNKHNYKNEVTITNIKVLNNIEAVNEIVEKSNTTMIIAWGKLYKKSLFNNIRYPKGKYHEDEFVTYKLFYKSKKIIVTDAKLYYYTQRKDSITGDLYGLKRLEKLEGLKEAISFFKIENQKTLEEKARIRYLLNLQIAYYRVKYEMENQLKVLEKLKEEYDLQYKVLMDSKKNIPRGKALGLKFFYHLPNLYCLMVKIFIGVKKSLTFKYKAL